MAKRSSASSAQGKRAKKNAKNTKADKDIDFSDIPELTDEQLKGMKRMGRPLLGLANRQLISLRVDPDILLELKKQAKKKGKGYQTLINEILAQFVNKDDVA